MQKIGDIPNARADSNGEFTDGNVAGGVPPTILPAEWFNTIQRELISVLTLAGITPDSAKFDQVATAVAKLITDGGFLKTTNNLVEIKNAGAVAVAATLANLGLSPHGLSRFTSSGSFIVPEGVTQIWVSAVAGGGGGGSSLATNSSSFVTGGSGGGAGQSVIGFLLTVTPGQVIPVTIGIGGTGGTAATNNATAGGNTQLGVGGALLNLIGGSPGSLGGGGTTFPASYGGPPGGVGYPNGSYALDTVSFSATAAYGGQGGQGASGPFGQSGPPGRGAQGQNVAAFAGFGYGAGGSGAGGAYASSVSAAGAPGAAGLSGYLVIEW